MSWLSPKRRKTTGNLKTLSTNGQGSSNGEDATTTPGSPTPAPRTPGATERPPTAPSTPRPLSQPVLSSVSPSQTDGNLFYAYARRGDDLQSRYLLTFASASIANEWWLFLQANFQDCTRPGPQLFSFKDAELLPKAWKHPAFAHLKSKWMYISFSDTKHDGLGGAAQGIIPVQDAQGNMLGGSAPASPELLGKVGQARREAKEVRGEVTRLEEMFERVMGAVERNTEQIAALAEGQQQHRSTGDAGTKEEEGAGGYFNQSELSQHLGRINDLLARNSEHVEGLAKRQNDNDEKLRSTLAEVTAKQKTDYLDMSQLSDHLDRIQTLMEQTATERKDSAKELAEQRSRSPPPPPAQIDFSPLTDGLDRVQKAVEQNSELVKALLDEGNADSKPGTPFWGKDTPIQQPPPQLDLSPLTEHLQKIHAAIEQQSSHMQALVGFASGGGGEDDEGDAAAGARPRSSGSGSGGGDTAEKSLAPLGEHLEQIYNAIEEGNKYARSLPLPQKQEKIDFGPLLEAQNATREAVEANNHRVVVEKLDAMVAKLNLGAVVDAVDATREAVEAGSKATDFRLLADKLDGLVEHMPNLDLAPLLNAQNATREAVERSSKAGDIGVLAGKLDGLVAKLDLKPLLDAQNATRAAIEDSSKAGDFGMLAGKLDGLAAQLDLKPLLDAQNATREAVENSSKAGDLGLLAGKLDTLIENTPRLDLAPLLDAQHATRAAVEASSKAGDTALLAGKLDTLIENTPKLDLEPLLDVQNATRAAVESGNKSADLGLLAGKLDGLIEHIISSHAVSQQQDERLQQLVQGQKTLCAVVSAENDKPATVDLGPLEECFGDMNEHLESLLETIREQMDARAAVPAEEMKTDLGPLVEKFDGLNEHLEALREWSEYNSEQLKDFIETQKAASASAEADRHIDIAPLTGKFDVLGNHLEALLSSSDKNAENLKQVLEANQSAPPPPPPIDPIDLTPLTDRLNRIHATLETQSRRDSSPGSGDPKFIMSALTSHLSKIQAVTEANAHHVKTLREKQSASQDKMHIAVSQTSDTVSQTANQVRSLSQSQSQIEGKFDARLEATTSQVRELMGGHREMVEVMRELAKSITAQNKGACDHVVVPPPRKVGRKIVGFVYDAKDGPVPPPR